MTTTTLFHILSYNNRPFTPLFTMLLLLMFFAIILLRYLCVCYICPCHRVRTGADGLMICCLVCGCVFTNSTCTVFCYMTRVKTVDMFTVLVTCMVSFFVFPSLDLITAPVRITLGHTDIQRESWHKNKLFQDELKQR